MKIGKFYVDRTKTEILIHALPVLISFIISARIAELYRLCGEDIGMSIRSYRYLYMTFPRWEISDITFGLLFSVIVSLLIYSNTLKNKKLRPGEEHGSSRWGSKCDIAPFIDANFFNNIILSATEFLTMSPKMKLFELNRNKNVIIYGGSGSGKTFSYVKSNLMQLNASYVLTDPKGTLLPETGNLFYKKGYRIKVFNTIDFDNSMHYNPFIYLKREKDILSLARTLFANLKVDANSSSQDPFWDNAVLLWLQAIIGYIWYEAVEEEMNLITLIEMLDASEIIEGDESYMNAVDEMFKELEENKPRHFAVRQYKKYKLAAGKTAKSILIMLGSMLSSMDSEEIRKILVSDDLELDTYGDSDQKTILYVIMSDTDPTYNFLSAMVFTQLFNVLCYKADVTYNGKLKVPVRFILDEFASFMIPRFQYLIATIRSRLVSAEIILQTKSQLKSIYKDDTDTIIGNCDTAIFLGGNEESTIKSLSESLGEETIDVINDSESYSRERSSGINSTKTGRKLMNIYELGIMNRKKCIVQVSGLPPFISDKYDTTSHPNFKYLSDYDENNRFDFCKYRRIIERGERTKIQDNDLVVLYTVS